MATQPADSSHRPLSDKGEPGIKSAPLLRIIGKHVGSPSPNHSLKRTQYKCSGVELVERVLRIERAIWGEPQEEEQEEDTHEGEMMRSRQRRSGRRRKRITRRS